MSKHLRELFEASMEPVRKAVAANVEAEDQEIALDMAGSGVWLACRAVVALERIADAHERIAEAAEGRKK